MALTAAAVMDGTWTAATDMLATGRDCVNRVAVAVCNGREREEGMHPPLVGAHVAEQILSSWLADAPEGSRRDAQVKYGHETAHPETAFVTLREHPVHSTRQRRRSGARRLRASRNLERFAADQRDRS